MLTMLIALTLFARPVRADGAIPHVATVAVARAQIISGVRVEQVPERINRERQVRETPLPRPRERPCPEREATPCRLMIIDMP
jgi:hypothetical protein